MNQSPGLFINLDILLAACAAVNSSMDKAALYYGLLAACAAVNIEQDDWMCSTHLLAACAAVNAAWDNLQRFLWFISCLCGSEFH